MKTKTEEQKQKEVEGILGEIEEPKYHVKAKNREDIEKELFSIPGSIKIMITKKQLKILHNSVLFSDASRYGVNLLSKGEIGRFFGHRLIVK